MVRMIFRHRPSYSALIVEKKLGTVQGTKMAEKYTEKQSECQRDSWPAAMTENNANTDDLILKSGEQSLEKLGTDFGAFGLTIEQTS